MNRKALYLGVLTLLPLALLGLFAPWLAPYDPNELVDPVGGKFRPPLTALAAVELTNGRWKLADRAIRVGEGLKIECLSETTILPVSEVANLDGEGVADRRVFLLGSDRFGRDVLSRIIYGARVSLQIAFLSVALSMIIGIGIGALAAMGPRLLDAWLMRFIDGLLAFPFILLLILLAAFYDPGPGALILMLASTTWMPTARFMRAELLSLQQRDFVIAARGLGAHPWHILTRHLLPNALTPVLVQSVLLVGNVILFESTLSFLGWGIERPFATWGNMIAQSRGDLSVAWWTGVFPGLALAFSVIVLNLATDALRDLLDPRWSPTDS